MMVESLLLMEREQIAGADYRPATDSLVKGGSQKGSVYFGQSKVGVQRPRLHGPGGEIPSHVYRTLRNPSDFSEELLSKTLHGLAGRRYSDTVSDAAGMFGYSKSSVSRRIVEATAKHLQEFQERPLSQLDLIAVFLDTIHRGGQAYIVGLGVDRQGDKHPLGFWEGSTENSEICKELIDSLERRGLNLCDEIIWVTDGGSGVIKCLRERFGKRLLHVRCWIHKLRNIMRHLAKRYRPEAKRMFKVAIQCAKYSDAKKEFAALVKWLRKVNESAANSLEEGLEELLTLQRLQCPDLLRRTLSTTNPIESMFAGVRQREKNIKRYRSSKMSQRWLGTILLESEKGFRKVKGFQEIDGLVTKIRFFRNELAMAA
jgi:transposase-like protein